MDSTSNKKIQVFVENLADQDKLIEVNPNRCIADSLADSFRLKKRTLQGMYATRKGKTVRLWSSFRKEGFENMDILSLHQKLKGGGKGQFPFWLLHQRKIEYRTRTRTRTVYRSPPAKEVAEKATQTQLLYQPRHDNTC